MPIQTPVALDRASRKLARLRVRSRGLAAAALVPAMLLAACSPGEEAPTAETLTIYTSRHYDSDHAIYEAFEKATGVKVEAVEADGDLLIERIKADATSNPPDVIIAVDIGRMWRADQEGLLAPLDSALINERLPASLRHPAGHWFGIAQRARIVVYATDRVKPGELTGYESLAAPAFKGRVCARSSGSVYNISLLAALVDRWGEDRAGQWASGVAGNLARAPQGGDIDQIRAVAAGECDVALVNHYYFARLLREEPAAVGGLAVFWPQAAPGVHVNTAAAGVGANARNPELARRFLEFTLSDEGQKFFPELTNEFPAVKTVAYNNPALSGLGEFTADPVAADKIGANQDLAQRLFDRAGWP